MNCKELEHLRNIFRAANGRTIQATQTGAASIAMSAEDRLDTLVQCVIATNEDLIALKESLNQMIAVLRNQDARIDRLELALTQLATDKKEVN